MGSKITLPPANAVVVAEVEKKAEAMVEQDKDVGQAVVEAVVEAVDVVDEDLCLVAGKAVTKAVMC